MATQPLSDLNSKLVPVYTGDGAFTPSQVDLITRTIAKDCTKDELALFLEVCRSSGLDPFRKQIYAIKRGGQMTIQTGIDGYRLLAARTGDLAGIDDPVYDTEDEDHPNRASVTVWRWSHGQRVAYTATARWKEYQQSGGNWGKMPYLMLGKCAEALALRRAFPAELSGVYTADEMAQADEATASYVEATVEDAPARATAAHAIWKALADPDVALALQQMGKTTRADRESLLGLLKREMDERGEAWNHDSVLEALRVEAGKRSSLEHLQVGQRGN